MSEEWKRPPSYLTEKKFSLRLTLGLLISIYFLVVLLSWLFVGEWVPVVVILTVFGFLFGTCMLILILIWLFW